MSKSCRLLLLPFIYYMLVLLDCCSTCMWYRIVSISILPIPSGQILGIVSTLYLLVSPITNDPHSHVYMLDPAQPGLPKIIEIPANV